MLNFAGVRRGYPGTRAFNGRKMFRRRRRRKRLQFRCSNGRCWSQLDGLLHLFLIVDGDKQQGEPLIVREIFAAEWYSFIREQTEDKSCRL